MGVIFQKKGKQMLKKGKIFEKLGGGGCTKFENILKKGKWFHAIVVHNELI